MRQQQSFKERNDQKKTIPLDFYLFLFHKCENEILIWPLQKWFEFKSARLDRNVFNLFVLEKRTFREIMRQPEFERAKQKTFCFILYS